MSSSSKPPPLLPPKGRGGTERDRLLEEKQRDGIAASGGLKSDDGNSSSSTGASSPAAKEDGSSTLVIAFFMMLFFQLGNRIFNRLSTFPMHNYPVFTNMMSCAIYIPICFAYIIPIVTYTDKISKEQQDIPKYKFAVMGLYDSVAGIMQTFATNYIMSSSTIVLVQQSAIPISMAISRVALKAEYTFYQYMGAGVVLCGIAVVLIPTLMHSPATTTNTDEPLSTTAADESNTMFQLFWIAVMVLSCVPMCMSSVYKEKALGETEIDVVYLNGWVAVYQFLFSIPLCVPSAAVINMAVTDILPNLWGGFYCWLGINTIVAGNPQGLPPDDCSTAPVFYNLYLAFNIVFNILIVVILKHGSANIMWMASTVIVPLSNVAFSLNFMPGHQPMNKFDVAGLFIILLGLVLYRFMGQISTYLRRHGGKEATDDVDAEERARLVGIKAESRQTCYVGLNQIEALNTLIDTRVWREQRQALYRSPQQIRGSFLVRLGIPPSPLVSFGHVQARSQGKAGQGQSPLMLPTRSPAGMQRAALTAIERGAAVAPPLPAAKKKQAAEV